MYIYRVRLYPELLKMKDGLDLRGSLPDVQAIAEAYNKNAETAVNKKQIRVESIGILNGNCIVLLLASDAWLEFPTKALRNFISKLSKIPPYCDLITKNGRLFKGESEFVEEEKKRIVLQPFSEEETLVGVCRLFFRRTDLNCRKINAIWKILTDEEAFQEVARILKI